jgi:hypothetical protein
LQQFHESLKCRLCFRISTKMIISLNKSPEGPSTKLGKRGNQCKSEDIQQDKFISASGTRHQTLCEEAKIIHMIRGIASWKRAYTSSWKRAYFSDLGTKTAIQRQGFHLLRMRIPQVALEIFLIKSFCTFLEDLHLQKIL